MMNICNLLIVMSGALWVLSGCAQTSCPCCGPHEDPRQYASKAKLRPNAQKAYDKVLSEGLVGSSYLTDSWKGGSGYIQAFFEDSTIETKYVMYMLTGFDIELGDGNNILAMNVLPALCSDLDAILRTDTPSPEDLDHAIWMASILELRNVVSFLEYMGAPAGKYKIGEGG